MNDNLTARKKVATVHDIAREAGVSASTVSRVLTGNTRVAPEKYDAVMEAIKRLNYRPNVVAQGLVNGKSTVIGVITQAIASPFYGRIMAGIELALQGSPYHPIFASSNWHVDEELKALDLLIGRRVDALIVLGGGIPNERLLEVANEIPLIAIGRTIEGLQNRCLQVGNRRGAYIATRYLLDLGHTRIAHIAGDLRQPDAIERRAGFYEALTDAGLSVDDQLIFEGDFQEQSGLMGVESLLARGVLFTALFVANDQMADGARLALYRHNLRVPQDISVVSFDDQPGSAYWTPPLTTIRQPATEMGIAAGAAILQLLNGKEPTLPTFEVELVVRESAQVFGQARRSGFARLAV